MRTPHTSLRTQVDKWVAPTVASPLRAIRAGRTSKGVRYVSVEVMRPAGPLKIAFFQHRDGIWQVFPPDVARPSMSARAA